MKKTTILLLISVLVGFYAIPAFAQKVKKNYDLHEIQKSHSRDSGLFSDYPAIPLTSPYHSLNSTDETTNLNAIVPDFQVNDDIGDFEQNSPSISADGSGNFVITWEDSRNGNKDVYAQRFSSDGTTLGSNFQVNDVPSISKFSDHYSASTSISADNSGNFIIAWADRRNDNVDIYAQRYSSEGIALGSNFQVNDDQGSARQRYPSITADDSGNFIITWVDERNSMEDDIYAQRYSSDGTAQGSNYKVNDNQGSAYQSRPSISADGSGNFIITWLDLRNGNPDIYAQRYSSDGTAIGSNFKVNDDQGIASQIDPSISVDASGNFVIAWEDRRNSNYDIYSQRYASDGTTLGSNFKVNDDNNNSWQDDPSISVDGSGNIIITWIDDRNSSFDIYAQRYSSDGTALGSNFQVNEVQGDVSQTTLSSSADDSGNIIITWQDERNDNTDIYAQRYSGDGSTQGSNFKVNDDQGSENQINPAISVDESGDFIITWADGRNSTEDDIYAQRYSSDGTALGSNFKVNDDQGSAAQRYPAISVDSSGNFIITWHDKRNSDEDDIYAQRYSSEGTALGSNFKVNDYQGSSYQGIPSISIDSSGNYIITWHDYRNGNQDIYAQRYASDGTTLGSNFKVNDDQGIAYQFVPSIAADGSGNFIITWQDGRNSNRDIYAQRYASNGTKLGSNFKVNDDQGSAAQRYPAISVDSSGNFIITWGDDRNGDQDIYAQRYSSDGTELGGNFQVNDDQGSAAQLYPSISIDSSGNYIITWHDYRNGNWDIYAQRYLSDGNALEGNYHVTNTSEGTQGQPDVKLRQNKIYSTWHDNRASGTGFDIWANVLNWDDPWGTSVDELNQVSSQYVLHQNYPNPFNPSTTIEFTLPNSEFVTLKIYNILGEEISTPVNNKGQAGNHTYQFDGSNLASGVYYYRIEAGEFQDVKKMILLR